MPVEFRFIGPSALVLERSPICFAFNTGGCDGAPPGGQIKRGRHVCVLTACLAAHCYSKIHK